MHMVLAITLLAAACIYLFVRAVIWFIDYEAEEQRKAMAQRARARQNHPKSRYHWD